MTNDIDPISKQQDAASLVESALDLIKSGACVDAQQRLFTALSHDPFNPRARLLLARVFFELRHIPFAIRELEQVHGEMPENKYVRNLLTKLAPEKVILEGAGISGLASDTSQNTLAEVDFDITDLEELDKE